MRTIFVCRTFTFVTSIVIVWNTISIIANFCIAGTRTLENKEIQKNSNQKYFNYKTFENAVYGQTKIDYNILVVTLIYWKI